MINGPAHHNDSKRLSGGYFSGQIAKPVYPSSIMKKDRPRKTNSEYPRLEVRFRSQAEYDFAKRLLDEAQKFLSLNRPSYESKVTKKETILELFKRGLAAIKTNSSRE